MGKRDLMTVDYLSEPAHFADMFNAALFQGKEVIKAEQLEEADKELADLDTDKGEGVRHDNVKKCFQNTQLALLVIEDQMHVDYHMILRNMFAESLHYRRQWKKRKKEHQIKKDLKPGNEFISGMKKGEVFTPVVLLVVYFGEEPWDGPRSLHELLNLSGENEKWRPFLNDYQLNLFDYHDYESFEKFRSGLRVIFEFLRYADDKNRLREIVAEHPDHYYNIKEDTYQMVAVLTKSRELLQKEKECINEDGGKKYV